MSLFPDQVGLAKMLYDFFFRRDVECQKIKLFLLDFLSFNQFLWSWNWNHDAPGGNQDA